VSALKAILRRGENWYSFEESLGVSTAVAA
jgi:hypothetical protein